MAVRQTTLILLLAVSQAGGTQFHYPANCAKPNTMQSISGPAPPLPVLPQTFQTSVEVNMIHQQRTMIAQEFYDGPGNRAAVHYIQNNTKSCVVLDYINNQTLSVRNGVCYVSELTLDNNKLLFGRQQGKDGVRHIYSTNEVLYFSKRYGLTYMGKTTVRGIDVDHWQSCMYWSIMAANFTLDFYFSVYNWTDPVLHPQVPVRLEVKGILKDTFLYSPKYFHIYEYFDFRAGLWDGDISFQTPKGVICPGRKQTMSVPTLSNHISFREEIVTSSNNEVSQSDIWADYTNKLVRFDYRPSYPMYPYYTTNPVTEIHDFSSGVAYAIDRSLGNCSIIPIQNTSFDVSLSSSKSISNGQPQFVLKMKSPSELFFIDNTSYSYEGQRTVRGILCDVFISRSTAFKIPGVETFNSTFELFFSADPWLLRTNAGRSNPPNTNVPVRFDITTDDWVGFQVSYNIYNFNMDEPPRDIFDVSSCNDEFSKQAFILEFPEVKPTG